MVDARASLIRSGRRARRGVTSVARDLRAWRGGGLTSEDTYLAARYMHRYTGGLSSRLALAAVRRVPGTVDGSGPSSPLPLEWERARGDLQREGLARLPDLLSPEAVSRLEAFARTAPARITLPGSQRVHGTYDGRPDDTVAVFVVEHFLLAQPDIQRLLADERLWALARQYFGVGAVIHPPTLYWSCVGAQPTTHAAASQLARTFHWDYDGLRGLRLHVNLTNVDEGAAPMQYLAGSHRSGALRSYALRHGDMGIDEREIWKLFGPDDLRTLTGPAGSSFISDSQGLHRGTNPRTSDRLFLVLPMQASSFAGYQLLPRAVTPRDPAFAEAIANGRPELRLFVTL